MFCEFKGVFANEDHIPMLDSGLSNRVLIEESSVAAVQILDHVFPVLPIHFRMTGRNCRVVEVQQIIHGAANAHHTAG